MSMTQASSTYFEQVAGSWDSLRAGYFGTQVRESAITKAYLRPEMVVADVGAGTGFIAAGLAPLVRRVYLVDGSPGMLDVARKNLSPFNNLEFHIADGQELPFPDESLDAVFANMYLHHCPDPLGAIQEMVRVLRPGGRLVITDLDAHPYAWLKEEMADVWQGFDRTQVREWFKQAGLVNLVVDCTGHSCCAESSTPADKAGASASATISVFVATGTRRMAMREAVQQAYADRAEAGGCACSTPGETQASQACCSSSSDSNCCAPSSSSGCCGNKATTEEVTFATGYSADELAGAPQEAADISLGCGNPIAMANLKPGEVVLDIGSGGGLDSFLAAGKVGPLGRVIGVDMTPAMLDRARATAERTGITNVDFRPGYAEALPVEDESVDVILSNCVINLTEDKGRVFQEAFRVLKPGGRLEVSDVVTGGPVPLDLRESAEGWSECVTGALPEQEYLDLISQAGFQAVRTHRSVSSGEIAGVPVYSVIASAQKPGGR